MRKKNVSKLKSNVCEIYISFYLVFSVWKIFLDAKNVSCVKLNGKTEKLPKFLIMNHKKTNSKNSLRIAMHCFE